MFILNQANKVDIEPRMLLIPEFKAIWERDSSKSKAKAIKEFAYVYFVADYKSEYNIHGIEKELIVCKEIMEDEKYKPDALVDAAIAKYEKLQETFSMRYLKSVRDTINSLMKFYDELRYKSKSSNVTDYNPVPVMNAMKSIEDVLEKIEKWEKKVFSEEDAMTIRGGGKIGLFEDAEKASWLRK